MKSTGQFRVIRIYSLNGYEYRLQELYKTKRWFRGPLAEWRTNPQWTTDFTPKAKAYCKAFNCDIIDSSPFERGTWGIWWSRYSDEDKKPTT